MSLRKRSGFTLVELLVVITIIGALMSMLLPAVNRAREAARRAQCMNNQRTVAQAFNLYDQNFGELPGYVNSVGVNVSGQPKLASWVVPILQQIEQSALYTAWSKTTDAPVVSIESLTCASDDGVRSVDGGTSFVVNAGRYDPTNSNPMNDQNIANGVFLDNFAGKRTMSIGFMTGSQADGASSTLMLSENIQVESWAVPNVAKYNVGMVWHGNMGPAPNISNAINGDVASFTLDWDHARPSSNHPGGVVVAFCDAHTAFLNETIQYPVFRQLMTSASARSDDGNRVLLSDDDY